MRQKLEDILKRTEWFRHDRFGMFIHWGIYAIPARGEWLKTNERMTNEEYDIYFDQFNPVDFDPKKWAKAAKDAGMKYVVMTAKHHDGFCLFDTKYSEYKSTNTKFGRDAVKEFVEAVRAEGLKVGLYFSIIDWHHKDFPKYNDLHHPMRGNEKYKDEIVDFDGYLDFMHHQVEELMTNYGKIDIIWFDFSYENMSGETWKATKLIQMVRRHQPHIIIDNRLEGSGEGFGTLVSDDISFFSGDFVSPEQALPHKGIRNINGELVPWELCLTMNNHWGYHANDTEFKSSKLLIRKLVECVSKGGNMLLNVGPDARGNIPKESLKILGEMGEWMKINSESIYGCTLSDLPKPEWGYYTQDGNKLYAHVFEQPIGPLSIENIAKEDISYVERLSDYSQMYISNSWTIKEYDITFLDMNQDLLSRNMINDMDTVIRLYLNK
ncbi:MAG: alpha-L-fucosidase [Tissierellia bacterium]|nr:alpha-L-fucosidase [Tissierellia bacterium]